MPCIVIPTFNRSKKLFNVIKAYSKWSVSPSIYILDASTGSHLRANLQLSNFFNFVNHIISPPSLGFSKRVLWWLETNPIESEILFIGNDEDVFTESYTAYAENFLDSQPGFSTVIGSYLTIKAPFLWVAPQIAMNRIIPFQFTLTGPTELKIHTHLTLNKTAKIPPLFFGARRKSQFLSCLRFISSKSLKESTEELIDQLTLLSNGNIAFVRSSMLLRDETRCSYAIEPTRHDHESYIPQEDILAIVELLDKLQASSAKNAIISTYFPAAIADPNSDFAQYYCGLMVGLVPSIFHNKACLSAPRRLIFSIALRVCHFVNLLFLPFQDLSWFEVKFLLVQSIWPIRVNALKSPPISPNFVPAETIQYR
jgi:hypothetical protein